MKRQATVTRRARKVDPTGRVDILFSGAVERAAMMQRSTWLRDLYLRFKPAIHQAIREKLGPRKLPRVRRMVKQLSEAGVFDQAMGPGAR